MTKLEKEVVSDLLLYTCSPIASDPKDLANTDWLRGWSAAHEQLSVALHYLMTHRPKEVRRNLLDTVKQRR